MDAKWNIPLVPWRGHQVFVRAASRWSSASCWSSVLLNHFFAQGALQHHAADHVLLFKPPVCTSRERDADLSTLERIVGRKPWRRG